MRYRPFARTGMAISALSLSLDGDDLSRSAAGWRDLMHAGFEEGINAFEIIHPTPVLLQGVAEGAAAVERRLLFIALRVPEANDGVRLAEGVEDVIVQAKVGSLDLLTVDAEPGEPRGLPAAMRALKDHGRVRSLGVAGECDALTPHVEAATFDALITTFNIHSGWRERHMVRMAIDRQMAVLGCDPCPTQSGPVADAAHIKRKANWFAKPNPLAGIGTYAFLNKTPGWTAEQMCLGYALTEPSLATVQVCAADAEHLTSLAEVTERDLPAAASAQIEMARFSAERTAGAERRAERRSA